MATEPLLFISHKHSDREIAETLARFVRNHTAGQVRVHLSSSPHFEGPRLGQPLSRELKDALAQAEAVILVFTTETEDWSYCMWECGVATDPRDEHRTSVVVLQCTGDEPKPYGDQLRVDARDLDSVHGFVKSLLTTTDVFAKREKPVTGFSAEGLEISQFAAALHADLASVLPAGGGAEQSTPASPYIGVHLDDAAAKELRTYYLEGATERCLDILEHQATVVAEALGAESLLGMVLGEGTSLGAVLASWRQDHDPGAQPRWFWGLAEQMEAALGGKVRPVKWAPCRTALGRADLPYVAATRKTATGVHFDIYLVPIAPQPVPAKDRMLTIDQMYYKDESAEPLTGVLLMRLVKEMRERNATRLPVLHDGRPISIVHKATINEFLVQAIASRDVSELTLQDLLDAHAKALEGSYAEVAPDASIEEAREAMAAKPGCQDVFVTRNGRVVGWLPNVLFIQDQHA
jgi:hypothetical protein